MGLVVWKVVGGLRRRGWRVQEEEGTPPTSADLSEVVTATQRTCSSHLSGSWDLLASFPGCSHLGMRLRVHIVSSVSIYSSATM